MFSTACQANGVSENIKMVKTFYTKIVRFCGTDVYFFGDFISTATEDRQKFFIKSRNNLFFLRSVCSLFQFFTLNYYNYAMVESHFV